MSTELEEITINRSATVRPIVISSIFQEEIINSFTRNIVLYQQANILLVHEIYADLCLL